MIRASQWMIGVLCAVSIVVSSQAIVRGDEPDVDFTQHQMKKLRALRKTPFPVYSKTAKKGVVKVEPGNRAIWNDDAAVYLGDLGWTYNSSINLWNGFVFVNVGPSVVKVGSLELEKGEYAAYGNGKFQKETLAELAGKPSTPSTASSRHWTDVTGKFSTEGDFVEVKDGKAVLRKADGRVIRIQLERLSDQDRRHIDSLTTSGPKGDQEWVKQQEGQGYSEGPKQPPQPDGVPRGLTLDLGGGVEMEFVLIPAGSFMMGGEKGADDEKPVHKVTITKPFYLGKYEVTLEQWAVMGNFPSTFKGPKKPLERMSWDGCQSFLAKLNEKFRSGGVKFGLPTEAQWEYACRAGTTTQWSFGDDSAKLDDYAWSGKKANSTTHPVGQKKPNAWGLYDMHGNVWEWCADWYGKDYYATSPAEDPVGPDSGSSHVLRGGASNSAYPNAFRCAFRLADFDFLGPVRRPDYRGFRVARTLTP